jgi:hypothetical protein
MAKFGQQLSTVGNCFLSLSTQLFPLSHYKWEVEIVQKPESTKGFIPQKNIGNWKSDRRSGSFVWLNRAAFCFRRRLFRDVEKTILSAEAMLKIAFISFIINKL